MKEIRNKTARPIRIPLPRGKSVHVGPSNVAQISDAAAEHPSVQKLVEDGSIEILGDGSTVAGTKASGTARQQTQRNVKSFRRGTGDR